MPQHQHYIRLKLMEQKENNEATVICLHVAALDSISITTIRQMASYMNMIPKLIQQK